MKFKTKIYKLTKNKFYFKETYFFYVVVINNKFWDLVKKEKIKFYSINKFITTKNLANSLYKNAKSLIFENLGFLKIKKVNNLKILHTAFKLVALKINKNFYNLTQTSKFKYFDYKYNVTILIQFFKVALKTPTKLIRKKYKFNI